MVTSGWYIGCDVSWDTDDPNRETGQRVCTSLPGLLLTSCRYLCWCVWAGEEVYRWKEEGRHHWQILRWRWNGMQPYDELEPRELGGPVSRHHLWTNDPVRCIRHTFPTWGCWNFSSSLMASKDSRYILQLGRDMIAFPQCNKQLKCLLRYFPLSGS